MKNFTKSMFDSIRESLENQKSNNSGNFKDILKTEPGNSYIVRLIPNVNDPAKTIHHYFHHQWTSTTTNQSVRTVCPSTWGDRCPVCEERMKLYKSGTEEDKNRARELKKKENWLVNVLVVKDPKNSENDNQVKIFRYGKQIDKIINDAINGEDAEEFGPAIFDLTANGCNFRIKVEKNEGDYPTYVSSKFLSKSEIPGLNSEKIDEIYKKAFELDTFFEKKDNATIKKMVEEHFLGTSSVKTEAKTEAKTETKPLTNTEVKPTTNIEPKPNTSNESDTDDKIKDLLDGLDVK